MRQEKSFVLNVMRHSCVPSEPAFVGLTDEQEEGNFRWRDGTRLSFTHWNSGEPNNAEQREHYVEMTPHGGWNDIASDLVRSCHVCKFKLPFIEEHKLCPRLCAHHGSCNALAGTCTCDYGWTGRDCSMPAVLKYATPSGNRRRIYETARPNNSENSDISIREASAYCNANGGTLPTVLSAVEQRLLLSISRTECGSASVPLGLR